MSVRDIALQLGMSQPSAADTISALERKGFLFKSAANGDRRSTRIVLTEHGQACLTTAHL